MLFAVEGGGFFSSSASGYSKGLSLLLLGQRNEERPMRVSPWNQYQLVEQEVDRNRQPASTENQSACRCTSFVCFGCKSSGIDGSSRPKVGPIHKSEASSDSSTSSDDKSKVGTSGSGDESDKKVFLKSSLRKSSPECSVIVGEGDGTQDSLEEVQSNMTCCAGRRKVHWTDACGRELAEIREFEPSDEGTSDDELEHGGARRCACVIQ